MVTFAQLTPDMLNPSEEVLAATGSWNLEQINDFAMRDPLTDHTFRNYLLANDAGALREIVNNPNTFAAHANQFGIGGADAYRDFYTAIGMANVNAIENGSQPISITDAAAARRNIGQQIGVTATPFDSMSTTGSCSLVWNYGGDIASAQQKLATGQPLTDSERFNLASVISSAASPLHNPADMYAGRGLSIPGADGKHAIGSGGIYHAGLPVEVAQAIFDKCGGMPTRPVGVGGFGANQSYASASTPDTGVTQSGIPDIHLAQARTLVNRSGDMPPNQVDRPPMADLNPPSGNRGMARSLLDDQKALVAI